MEVVCGSEIFTVLAPHVKKNLGHWGLKVIKRERNQALGGKCQKRQVADSFKAVHSKPLGVPGRDKIVYWSCSLNIFGY